MEKIEDPWHSRPIDVHRWSDHPEVVQFVDRVWDDYLPKEVVNGPGPKPKMAFRKQLRVLILDNPSSIKITVQSGYGLTRGVRISAIPAS